MKKLVCFLLILLPLLVSCYSQDSGSKHDLVALKDSIQTEGTFFIGTGAIDSSIYYFFYYKDGDSIRLGKCYYDRGYLHEMEHGQPHVFLQINGFGEVLRADFHIPAGSVINQFELDLQ